MRNLAAPRQTVKFPRVAGTLDLFDHRFYSLSEDLPRRGHTHELRAAAYHDLDFLPTSSFGRGDYMSGGWGEHPLAFDAILDHQGVPKDAQRLCRALIGRSLYGIHGVVQNPLAPGMLTIKIEAALFLWGRVSRSLIPLLNSDLPSTRHETCSQEMPFLRIHD